MLLPIQEKELSLIIREVKIKVFKIETIKLELPY